jgi:hypothetical protein
MSKAHKGVPLAELPGYYLPETVAVIPSPNPRKNGAQEGGVESRLEPFGQNRMASNNGEPLRQPLSGIITGTPRPGGEVGSGRQRNSEQGEKPRNILDLLFGRKD